MKCSGWELRRGRREGQGTKPVAGRRGSQAVSAPA